MPPEVARCKCDHRIRTREEEEEKVKKIAGFEPEKKERSNSGLPTKFEAKNQQNRAKSKGSAKKRFESPVKTQVTHKLYSILLKITTNSERCESMEDSNCSVQNPNPNTKIIWKKQRNTSRFTTSVNQSESLRFYEVLIQKKTRRNRTVRTCDWNSRFMLIRRTKVISSD